MEGFSGHPAAGCLLLRNQFLHPLASSQEVRAAFILLPSRHCGCTRRASVKAGGGLVSIELIDTCSRRPGLRFLASALQFQLSAFQCFSFWPPPPPHPSRKRPRCTN